MSYPSSHANTPGSPLPIRLPFVLRAMVVAAVLTLAATGKAAGEAGALPTAAILTPMTWTFTATEGQSFSGIVAAFTDSALVAASNFTPISIDWGDGASTSAGAAEASGVNPHLFFISGAHTYAEEGTYFVVVAIHAVADNSDHIFSISTVGVEDAPLCVCPEVIPSGLATFAGTGGNSSAGGALNGRLDFEAAIGGANNGPNPVPQPNGFRTLNWDGVTLNGTDFGGNTTTMVLNKTVGIPVNRFQERGALFGRVNAVSGDGFATVNPGVTGIFTAFSASNDFAPINTHEVDLSFVLPSAHTTTAATAGTRGFGGLFINVRNGFQSSIEYFAGPISLGEFYVPVGSSSSPAYAFLGALFSQPIVTRVHLTLGSGTIFRYDGTSFASDASDNTPMGANVVALDDLVYSEPHAFSLPAKLVITPTVSTAFTGTVGTFIDTDANGNAADFTALIDWGDGHSSPGHISAFGGGGFNVSGSNMYATGGTFEISFTVEDFGGARVIGSSEARVPLPLFLPTVLH